jgi:hypothetical protein
MAISAYNRSNIQGKLVPSRQNVVHKLAVMSEEVIPSFVVM